MTARAPSIPGTVARLRARREELLVDVLEREEQVAGPAGELMLAGAVVAPGGERAAHPEVRDVVQMVELVVDEGDLLARLRRFAPFSDRPCCGSSPCT